MKPEALADLKAAKDRVERFRGGEIFTGIYNWDIGNVERLRADLNTIAAYEAGQVEQAPQVPQIDARTVVFAAAMAGLLARGAPSTDPTYRRALTITAAALSALKVNHD